MPQVTFYLRKEDIDKWKSLSKKAEFIHNALNNVATQPTQRFVKETKIETIKAKIPGMITAADLTPKIQERGTCRRCGSILDTRGACLNKKC
jgi:hypothetical protein